MNNAIRITIIRAMVTRAFVVPEPTTRPDVGDVVNFEGENWYVQSVEDTEILARLQLNKRTPSAAPAAGRGSNKKKKGADL